MEGLRRKRPTSPPGRYAKRDDKIIALIERRRWSRAKICEHFGLKPSWLGVIIARHPRIRELLRQRVRPAEIARRFRMETSAVLRITGKKVERTRTRWWAD